jgi:hypothetical protein
MPSLRLSRRTHKSLTHSSRVMVTPTISSVEIASQAEDQLAQRWVLEKRDISFGRLWSQAPVPFLKHHLDAILRT